MDPGNDLEIIHSKKNCMDNVTPHKIAVVAFIREYGLLKMESKTDAECIIAPKYRKDFCILALKIIQCPDMEFKELENLLSNGQYHLSSVHLQNFCVSLQNIYVNGVSALVDCVVSAIDKLMIEQCDTMPCLITRSSVLGFYLRRVALYLDKLTFVQLGALYKSFCLYYQKGRPGLIIRSQSKEKLNNMEIQNTLAAQTTPEESKQQESFKMTSIDRDHAFEEGQWSRKQAELFAAQQANLLQINEQKAMPAKQLQKTIMNIVHDIPDYADIHFLSFLNCIRMKEFCGAQDSLYNCFDRSVAATPAAGASTVADRNKHFRYAALNRAAMHMQFGHNEVAMEAVKEALVMGQEAGDSACLAAAAAWSACAARGAEREGRPPRESPRPRAAAAAAAAATHHLQAQHLAVNGAPPHEVFSTIAKGDSINYLHSMTDLTLGSLANTAALWALYGKTEMASVYCQLLLNLNSKSYVGGAGGGVYHWGEASAAAVAGVAAAAAWRGDAALHAALVSSHRADSVDAVAKRAAAEAALYAGRWAEAELSIKQLASSDRWESQYLKAELYFLKGNLTDSMECLTDILDFCKTEDDSLHFVSLRLRAMILMSQVKQSFRGKRSLNNSDIMILNDALGIAKQYHLHYLAAAADMNIASVLLHLGSARAARRHARRALPALLAHAGAYDAARALLLYSKCRAAAAPGGAGRAGRAKPAGASAAVAPRGGAGARAARAHVLRACCAALDAARNNFQKVGAQARLLDTCYLQAQLYHELGDIAARNQCAWMYRQLEGQGSAACTHHLLMMY